MTRYNKISAVYRKPTRLEELHIKRELSAIGIKESIYAKIIIHSFVDCECYCKANIEINKYNCTGKDPVLYSVKLMRVVL